MKRVLVADDYPATRHLLVGVLEQLGLDATEAETGEEALDRFRSEAIDLVITDLRMPGMSGIDLLRQLREGGSDVPVIVLTAYGTVHSAVEAMQSGAFDFLQKPFEVDAVKVVIHRALQLDRYRTENSLLKDQLRAREGVAELIGGSAALRQVHDMLREVAPARSPVLITGETGTGKELVARAIHGLSGRGDRVFVAINCAAIPNELLESELFGHVKGAFTGAQTARQGKFEATDGSTLFLDEIGDMAYPLQAKLLRVIEEGVIERVGSNTPTRVDVRVVSSTNRDLAAAIEGGTFRRDLYYRLNVFHVELPPLRERAADVAPIAAAFLKRFAAECGKPAPTLTPQAEELLRGYSWPGNVRELRNMIERAVVLCKEPEVGAEFFRSLIPASEAPGTAPQAQPEGMEDTEDMALEPALARVERRLLTRAIAASGDRKADAAKLLQISERTLWYKLKKHNL